MKRFSNRIPFGLKNGILVDVSAVESGLACGCICPSCHGKLQAKKGSMVSHYFSHDPSENMHACETGFETAVHLMAKQILAEEGSAFAPELIVRVTQADANGAMHQEKGVVESKSLKKFDRVELETRLDDIRPDIIAYQGDEPLLIEVAVTNFSDREKINLIRSKLVSAIEIDLSKVSYTIKKEDLRQLIVENVKNKKWLSNPAATDVKRGLQAALDEKIKKINEGIRRSRQQLRSGSRSNVVLQKKRSKPSVLPLKPAGSRQHEARWFLCEACKHVFNASRKDAPYTIETLPCPECEHPVVAKI